MQAGHIEIQACFISGHHSNQNVQGQSRKTGRKRKREEGREGEREQEREKHGKDLFFLKAENLQHSFSSRTGIKGK